MKINLIYLSTLLFSVGVHAEVIVDHGSDKQLLISNEGEFTIDEAQGSVSGNNLFHQFDKFNLKSNETARFTGSDDIKMVINRVTGNDASIINGNIVSEMNADFWFINSNGIYIGDNATFDVTGALNLTTAGKLVFDNGLEIGNGSIDEINIENESSVILNGVNITSNDMASLNIISRNINVHNSNIDIGGELNLISVNKMSTDSLTGIMKGDETVLNIINTNIGNKNESNSTTYLQGATVFVENSEINNSTIQSEKLIDAEKLNISNSTINVNTNTNAEIFADYMVFEYDSVLSINSQSESNLNFQLKGDKIYLQNKANIDAIGTSENYSLSIDAENYIKIDQSTIDAKGEVELTSKDVSIDGSNITTSEVSLITLSGENNLYIDKTSILSPNNTLPQSSMNQTDKNDFNSDISSKNIDSDSELISESSTNQDAKQPENNLIAVIEQIESNLYTSPNNSQSIVYKSPSNKQTGVKSSKSTLLIRDTNEKEQMHNSSCDGFSAIMSPNIYLSTSISNLDISNELDQGSSLSCL